VTSLLLVPRFPACTNLQLARAQNRQELDWSHARNSAISFLGSVTNITVTVSTSAN